MNNRAPTYVKMIMGYCQDIIDIIESFGCSYETFLSDIKCQYSVCFCIGQIGDLVRQLREGKDCTENYTEKYPEIPWNKIAGMRNIIIHTYHTVDLEMVFDVCTKNIPELLEGCQEILQIESSLEERIKKADKVRLDNQERLTPRGISKDR